MSPLACRWVLQTAAAGARRQAPGAVQQPRVPTFFRPSARAAGGGGPALPRHKVRQWGTAVRTNKEMHSSAKSPPPSVQFFCSCDTVYHKQKVRIILNLLGQIVTWQSFILIHWNKNWPCTVINDLDWPLRTVHWMYTLLRKRMCGQA